MIILIIAFVLIGICSLLIVLCEKYVINFDCSEWLEPLSIVMLIASCVTFLITGITGICENCETNCTSLRMQYETAIAELNASKQFIYDIKDDYAKSVAVQSYNANVREWKVRILDNQYKLVNPWINIFICNEYANMDANQFTFISL